MNSSTYAACLMAAFIASPVLADQPKDADQPKEMCPEECPAYQEHPDKDSLALSDIHQLCVKSGVDFARLVRECAKSN